MFVYKASYVTTDDGWYLGEVLDSPGVQTQGKSLRGCRRMLADALQTMAAYYLEEGKPLPPPDPTVTSAESELEEPIYLMVAAANDVDIVPRRPVVR